MSRLFFERIAKDWDSWESPETFAAMKKMVEKFDLPSEATVLDVGCGTGNIIHFMKEKKPECRIIGLDYAFGMLNCAAQKGMVKLVLLQADALKAPFHDNSFDRLICFSCFPHFQNKKIILNEFYRLLKPDGLLYVAHIVSSAEINKLHSKIDGPVKHDILPDADEMKQILQESGFSQTCVYDHEYYLAVGRKPAGDYA